MMRLVLSWVDDATAVTHHVRYRGDRMALETALESDRFLPVAWGEGQKAFIQIAQIAAIEVESETKA